MSAERIDFAAEGLLGGLEGEEREERVALLERFSADGVPLEELRRRTADGTLMFVPADRVIAGEERYTLTQIAELSGVELDFLIAVRRAMRLPVSREVAVCFADLVGFTRLGEQVPPEELGQLAVRLEALATEVARAPVRLVKTIGDAAMLAAAEPAPLLDAALELIDAADSEGEHFPQLRAGAALGRAVPRAGDWFGRPVNLASRVTAVARPGSLLAERELRESARDAYQWSYAGERRLRGIRDPVPLFRARRGEAQHGEPV